MDDWLIIKMFFERSEQAINSLSLKYGNLCKSISYNILSNKEDAEECVNDVYLAVWNTIPPQRPDSLSAYISKITRNISLKKYRRNTADKRNNRYDISLDELQNYSIIGNFVTCDTLIEGNWKVSFPIEKLLSNQ